MRIYTWLRLARRGSNICVYVALCICVCVCVCGVSRGTYYTI